MEDQKEDHLGEAIARFGLPARPESAEEIRSAILAELEKEKEEEGDQFLIKLLSVQLFSLGHLEDSLFIWAIKQFNFDLSISIDVQQVCTGGVETTKEYLRNQASEEALKALEYVEECEQFGDFQRFSPHDLVDYYRSYYRVG